jgi:hypothetical protein
MLIYWTILTPLSACLRSFFVSLLSKFYFKVYPRLTRFASSTKVLFRSLQRHLILLSLNIVNLHIFYLLFITHLLTY